MSRLTTSAASRASIWYVISSVAAEEAVEEAADEGRDEDHRPPLVAAEMPDHGRPVEAADDDAPPSNVSAESGRPRGAARTETPEPGRGGSSNVAWREYGSRCTVSRRIARITSRPW